MRHDVSMHTENNGVIRFCCENEYTYLDVDNKVLRLTDNDLVKLQYLVGVVTAELDYV